MSKLLIRSVEFDHSILQKEITEICEFCICQCSGGVVVYQQPLKQCNDCTGLIHHDIEYLDVLLKLTNCDEILCQICGHYAYGDAQCTCIRCFEKNNKLPEPSEEEPKSAPCSNLDCLKFKRDQEERLICKMCMETDVSVAFIPCGHVACCETCSEQIKECLICRAVIEIRFPIYIA